MNASVHHLTPTMSVIGPRGEAVRQVDYLRKVAGEDVRALINRQQYDVAGHMVAQRDPRLPTPNTITVHRLDAMGLKTHSLDGGENISLPGLGGEPVQIWDANGNHRELTYDIRLRLRSVKENAVPDFEVFTWLDDSADPAYNLRGQMTALSDPSGAVNIKSFNMIGQSLEEIRTFADGKICTSRQAFSAVGALLQTTDAGGHVQKSTYDIAGQLTQVQLQLRGQSFRPILNGADYNAAGQITEQRLGNGVTSHWHYRATDGRLLRQYAQKTSEPAVQDFEYDYDRVGTPLRIIDHTYKPTFFHNQRVDGERTFNYDSVGRLIRTTSYSDAPPADNPGRPQPTDPDDRRNYVESFEYDDGNNLKKLTHIRDGNTHTREMFIDSTSNRGVRWKPGDPAPDFGASFDRAGNLRALKPGQPVNWNSRNQLQSLILVEHASGPADQELYQYSQGARVYKRHETHTRSVSHVAEVHYVGNLEIRTKSSGEELHRITVATGVGEVTCLHWVAGKPPGIDADQVCYSHSDHLGSSVTQIDQRAQVISRESYYAFGGTASMAARSQIEADYKFTRYSGKEMDVTGLYYYGARYYAPWLCRWVSADPAGDADGLNRYAFVGNCPMRFVDPNGASREESVIYNYSNFISSLSANASQTLNQMHDILHKSNITRNLLGNLIGETARGVLGYEAGALGTEISGMALPETSSIQFATPEGLLGSNLGGDLSAKMDSPVTKRTRLIGSLIPQTSKISIDAIDEKLGLSAPAPDVKYKWKKAMSQVVNPALNSVLNSEFVMNRMMSTWISIIPAAISMFGRAIEAEDIKSGLTHHKIDKILDTINEWETIEEQRWGWTQNAFDALGADAVYPREFLSNTNHMTSPEALAPITRKGLQSRHELTRIAIRHTRQLLNHYREMSTTDNQFLMRQAQRAKGNG